jgi:hypothetical protein
VEKGGEEMSWNEQLTMRDKNLFMNIPIMETKEEEGVIKFFSLPLKKNSR